MALLRSIPLRSPRVRVVFPRTEREGSSGFTEGAAIPLFFNWYATAPSSCDWLSTLDRLDAPCAAASPPTGQGQKFLFPLMGRLHSSLDGYFQRKSEASSL